MLDTCATHNFVAMRVIPRLGAKVLDEPHFVKTVNAVLNAANGLVQVPTWVGSWSTTYKFMVVAIDDFDIILGAEFFMQAKVMLFLYLRLLMISDEATTCIVTVIQVSTARPPSDYSFEFSLQLKVGLHRGEETYHAHIKVIDEEWVEQKVPRQCFVP